MIKVWSSEIVNDFACDCSLDTGLILISFTISNDEKGIHYTVTLLLLFTCGYGSCQMASFLV